MQLSKNFTLEEFTVSQEATRKSIDNTPSSTILSALTNTAENLELVRKILGQPISISSGYRSIELNKSIGGVATSQHCKGEAVDFISPKFGTPKQIVDMLKNSRVPFDQLILEYDRWVHVSFANSNRKQVLVIDSKGTRVYS